MMEKEKEEDQREKLKRLIYREIGWQDGFSIYEEKYEKKNEVFYQQELKTILKLNQEVDLVGRGNKEFVQLQELLKQSKIEEKISFIKLLLENSFLKTDENETIWEECQNMESYIHAGGDFLEAMVKFCKYFSQKRVLNEKELIKMSMLMNAFVCEKVESRYYIPFTRYFNGTEMENDVEILRMIWNAWKGTNYLLKQIKEIRENAFSLVEEEKAKKTLQEAILMMEEEPIFSISDMEKGLEVAYNTAAKTVLLLEKYGIVEEVSKQQRYRVFVYKKYLEALQKPDGKSTI